MKTDDAQIEKHEQLFREFLDMWIKYINNDFVKKGDTLFYY
jgi:hypothetical protein